MVAFIPEKDDIKVASIISLFVVSAIVLCFNMGTMLAQQKERKDVVVSIQLNQSKISDKVNGGLQAVDAKVNGIQTGQTKIKEIFGGIQTDQSKIKEMLGVLGTEVNNIKQRFDASVVIGVIASTVLANFSNVLNFFDSRKWERKEEEREREEREGRK